MEKKPRKLGKKWIFIAGAMVVVVALGVVLVLPGLQNRSSGSTSYTTQALQKGSLSATVGATGNVYTRQSVQLSWETSGIVSKVNVTKGQQVEAGTVLAELDQSSLPQTVLSASTDLAAAQKDLEDLLNSNTSRANAELALITAEESLQSAQQAAQSKLYQRASDSTVAVAQANLVQAKAALEKAEDLYNQNKSRGPSDLGYAETA